MSQRKVVQLESDSAAPTPSKHSKYALKKHLFLTAALLFTYMLCTLDFSAGQKRRAEHLLPFRRYK